jgi:hypothetical protein
MVLSFTDRGIWCWICSFSGIVFHIVLCFSFSYYPFPRKFIVTRDLNNVLMCTIFSLPLCFEIASWHKIWLHLTSSNLLLWKLIFHMVLTTLLIWTSRFMFPYLIKFSMYDYKFYKLNCLIVANFKVPLERPLSSGPRPHNSSHYMLFYLLLVCCGTVLFFSITLHFI